MTKDMSPARIEAELSRGEAARFSRPDEARRAFAEAAEALRRLDRPLELAHALTRQARIERDTGDHAAALRFQTEAVEVYRQADGSMRLANALRHQADILDELDRMAEAAEPMAEMLALYRAAEAVPPLEMANAVRSAADHAQRSADLDQARALWAEARARYAALDDLFLELTGQAENPGVREATRRLEELTA